MFAKILGAIIFVLSILISLIILAINQRREFYHTSLVDLVIVIFLIVMVVGFNNYNF